MFKIRVTCGSCSLALKADIYRAARIVNVTDRRTPVDWAMQIRDLVDVHYPHAERITLVMDNLNTHTGARYASPLC